MGAPLDDEDFEILDEDGSVVAPEDDHPGELTSDEEEEAEEAELSSEDEEEGEDEETDEEEDDDDDEDDEEDEDEDEEAEDDTPAPRVLRLLFFGVLLPMLLLDGPILSTLAAQKAAHAQKSARSARRKARHWRAQAKLWRSEALKWERAAAESERDVVQANEELLAKDEAVLALRALASRELDRAARNASVYEVPAPAPAVSLRLPAWDLAGDGDDPSDDGLPGGGLRVAVALSGHGEPLRVTRAPPLDLIGAPPVPPAAIVVDAAAKLGHPLVAPQAWPGALDRKAWKKLKKREKRDAKRGGPVDVAAAPRAAPSNAVAAPRDAAPDLLAYDVTAPAVHVVAATFGADCPRYAEGHAAERGAFRAVFKRCHLAERSCTVRVTNRDTGGDPFPNCDKPLVVAYHCGEAADVRASKTVHAAHGTRTVTMACHSDLL